MLILCEEGKAWPKKSRESVQEEYMDNNNDCVRIFLATGDYCFQSRF
jgi:hypothetical protein